MSYLTQFEQSDFSLSLKDQETVVENLRELHENVLDTMAPNTRKAYLTDFNQYLAFCRENSLPSLASDWKTTKISILAFFELYMSKQYKQHNSKTQEDIGYYKHHSIKRKLASIRFFIGITELPDPFKHSKLLRMTINGKLKQKPSKQAQAPAITLDILEQLTQTAMDGSLLMLRDLTILNVGFDTLFRASNLVAIRIEDIDFEKGTVFAQYSKTDKTGEGHFGYLSKPTLTMISQLQELANIQDGYLFRALSPKHTVQTHHISTRSLWGVYKKLGKLIDKKINYSCHSTRTGAVITMVEKNVPMIEIMKHGDWKSAAMPGRYAEQYDVATTGMAKVR